MKRTQAGSSRHSLEVPSANKKQRAAFTSGNDLAVPTPAKSAMSTPNATTRSETSSARTAPETNLVKGSPSSKKAPPLNNFIDLGNLSDSDGEMMNESISSSRGGRSAIDIDMLDGTTTTTAPVRPIRPTVPRGLRVGPLSKVSGRERSRKATLTGPASATLDSQMEEVIENTQGLVEKEIVIMERAAHRAVSRQPIAGSSSHILLDPDVLMADGTTGHKDEEVLETEDLQVFGERFCSNDEDADDEDDERPVRLLTDFRIFKRDNPKELVPFDRLLDIPESELELYGATGVVRAHVSEDDSEDNTTDSDESESSEAADQDEESSTQRIRLADIIDVDTHYCFAKSFRQAERPVEYRIDEKTYLLTEHAWYILGSPADAYRVYFDGFARCHRILHTLLTAAQQDSRLGYTKFMEILDTLEDDSFSPAISSEDMENEAVIAHIARFLPNCARDLRVQRVNVIKRVLEQTNAPETAVPTRSASSSPRQPETRRPPPRRRTVSASESIAPRSRGTTAPGPSKFGKAMRTTDIHVEPIVKRVTQEYIDREISVSESASSSHVKEPLREVRDHIFHAHDPQSIKAGTKLREEDGRRYYKYISMDGVKYWIGDCVAVNPGQDEDKARQMNASSKASRSPNALANTAWFGIIRAIYKDPQQEYVCHLQWFLHGSKTILQELAHSQGLFMLISCDDVAAPTIYQKVDVDMDIRGEEPVDEKNPDEHHYHCAHVYDPAITSFTTAPADKNWASLYEAHLDDFPCPSCCLQRRKRDRESLRSDGKTYFSQYGTDYHVGDAVYLEPNRLDENCFRIGQITTIEQVDQNLVISVQLFLRQCQQDLPGKISVSDLESDDRCLIWGSRIISITARLGSSALAVHGKCYVKELHDSIAAEDWVQHDDHFYVSYQVLGGKLASLSKKQFHPCPLCIDSREVELADIEHLKAKHGINGKLRGLELFAGGGGLGKGMELSGFVNTALAVDYEPAAVETYRKNHPQAAVVCADSNKVLKAARGDASVKDEYGKAFPHLPKPCTADEPSAIDIIFGGPPCQSFSRANHYKDPDDIRSFLPLNMLSFVEAYKPDYFLLENVRGLLDFRLGTVKRGEHDAGDEDSIKNSMVKIILRTLIALGYQASVRVLQAGQYGVPQARERVIFLGAQLGLPMPEHPLPTHAFPKMPNTAHLADGTALIPLSRAPNGETGYNSAPLPPVTIEDAIGDLPRFDWINPHRVIRAKAEDEEEDTNRRAQGIKQITATPPGGFVGFPQPAAYYCPPRNRYQLRMRQNSSGRVSNHYTRRYGALTVEQCATVPLEPNVDFRRLPQILQPGGKIERRGGSFGRCGPKGFFATVMTNPGPGAKGTWLLHPTQKRTYTVRECARSQSFPDDFEFDTKTSKNPDAAVQEFCRIGGNAVPIELAKKLGQCIGAAMVKRWQQEEQEGSPEL